MVLLIYFIRQRSIAGNKTTNITANSSQLHLSAHHSILPHFIYLGKYTTVGISCQTLREKLT